MQETNKCLGIANQVIIVGFSLIPQSNHLAKLF